VASVSPWEGGAPSGESVDLGRGGTLLCHQFFKNITVIQRKNMAKETKMTMRLNSFEAIIVFESDACG